MGQANIGAASYNRRVEGRHLQSALHSERAKKNEVPAAQGTSRAYAIAAVDLRLYRGSVLSNTMTGSTLSVEAGSDHVYPMRTSHQDGWVR